MPLPPAADVYAISAGDTGAIHDAKSNQVYDVKHDADGSYGEHHETDLRALPVNERIYFSSYYSIVEARRDGDKRGHITRSYRLNGRRLSVVRRWYTIKS